MKKWLWSLLSVVLIASFVLSACGKSDSSSGDSKTITVWAMGDEGKLLKKLVPGFEKEEGIKVKIQSLPWDSAHDKLLTAVASGKGPDVIQMGTSWMPEFADAGALLDLSKYMKDHPDFNEDNFFPGAVESMKYDGKVYGIPWYVEARVLYYRKDLLQNVGYNEPPKTWDELVDAGKKLAARNDKDYGLDLDLNDQITPFMFAWQNGSDFVTKDGKLNFNTKEFNDGIKYFANFFKQGISQSTTGLDIGQAFKKGIKPMFISGPWMVQTVKDQGLTYGKDWGIAVLPKKVTNTSVMGGSNFVVFHNTKKVDQSLKFIEYMNKVKTQLKWREISNDLPARTAAYDEDSLKNDPIVSVFNEQLQDTKAQPQVTQWEAISKDMHDNLEKAIKGNENMDKALDDFRAQAKEEMNK
ncbi:sugar ABC transporter substrate-binding protein [Pullulanibacillus camelliae]|uniref:Sugar ABC transporter substrate-binding protein n=1 Tax=Pullulanibacillus camelliae TaxID=1707096 RepID=A0A8J2VGQ6_9BACL|nr:sugar ABC transporter substrate-binding protein [Pullulanibacillus camelliae]GGE26222.1 sugar ABC transporter substrate-binding protein [Pullulanibacillus camelliae]